MGTTETIIAFWTTGGLICAIIGFFLGARNNASCWGCILGLLLGPIGLIITVLIPRRG